MKFWEIFWTFALLISGCAFAFITVIVIFKGGPDLREMLRELRRQHLPREPHPPA
jgi:hypothetical protein